MYYYFMINVFANYANSQQRGSVRHSLLYVITVVNCYLETGLTCFVYCPKALYLFIFIVWLPL